MSIDRETRQFRDGWRTSCTVELDLGRVSGTQAWERIRAGVAELIADGLDADDISFETEVKVYYDGDQDITHTVAGQRPATPQEIRNAEREARRAELAHETALRKQLAEIEARRKATP